MQRQLLLSCVQMLLTDGHISVHMHVNVSLLHGNAYLREAAFLLHVAGQ